MKKLINLTVNNEHHEVWTSQHKTLLEVLREDLQLTGTKHGCELGECGACTVIIDGEPVLSCLVLPSEVEGCQIETVEGLAQHGKPHPLQKSFVELGAAQCGYCTPGMVMAIFAGLQKNAKPTEKDMERCLDGNICRCTGTRDKALSNSARYRSFARIVFKHLTK